MGTGHLPITSTFTATPLQIPFLAEITKNGIAVSSPFYLYGQMDDFMLRSLFYCPEATGAVVLLRLEDWLREDLKSSQVHPDLVSYAKHKLVSRSADFLAAVSALTATVPQVWIVVCPSNGWISAKYDLRQLFRTHGNVLAARLRQLPVTVLNCPPFLLNGECDDHFTDRLGQMPYTQTAFDHLGEFLAGEIKRTLRRTDSTPRPMASDSTPFATYLAGLNVQVKLARLEGQDFTHVERMLRTIAGFSLTGEKPFLGDEEVGRMLSNGDCLLVSVSDRLADYGPTGFVLFREVKQQMIVDAMALSCVVLGKQAEFAVLSALSHYAVAHGLLSINFRFAAADRNQPMQEFLESVANNEPGIGYVVDVSDVESRINKSAVKPGAWTVDLLSSFDDSGVRS